MEAVSAGMIALRAVEGVAESDAARLSALFERQHKRVYQLARRMLSSDDEARDLVQDTFVRAAEHVAKIPDGASREEAWLVRVAVNLCRDRWRHRRIVRDSRLHTRGAFPTTTPSDEARLIARDVVWTALANLPPRRRAVLVMYELEGLSVAQISALLGVTAVTVRWHLTVGRRELASVIERQS